MENLRIDPVPYTKSIDSPQGMETYATTRKKC